MVPTSTGPAIIHLSMHVILIFVDYRAEAGEETERSARLTSRGKKRKREEKVGHKSISNDNTSSLQVKGTPKKLCWGSVNIREYDIEGRSV